MMFKCTGVFQSSVILLSEFYSVHILFKFLIYSACCSEIKKYFFLDKILS